MTSMAKRVVFLCYHGLGHINPCFPLARVLEKQGHAVTIATVAHFAGYVTRAGFVHYPLKSVPFGLGFESWVNAQRRAHFLYWANLRDRYRDQLYHERERELTSLVNSVKPDVVFIDSTQATDFIVLYSIMKRRGIGHAILHAMFPTYVLPGRPPANSMVVPGDVCEEKAALRRMTGKMMRTDLQQRLMYFGMSDRYLIKRRLHQNEIPGRYQLAVPSLFDFQVADVPAFILAPQKFDYPGFKIPSNHHYLGFMSYEAPMPSDDGWSRVKSTLLEIRSTGPRMVYCSFGTVGQRDEKLVDAFLFRLAEAVTQQGNLLVISIGTGRTKPGGLERDNVWVFPTVPQADVLRYCDAFVTHGGMSSIKEAIEATVPMLVIPVHDQFDPPGNAARVHFHSLGILGDVHSEVDKIKTQLNTILIDQSLRENISVFREANSEDPEERFITLFNAL